MKLDKFNISTPFTVGMELEVRLINDKTYAPKNCSNIIFETIKDELKPHIHKELLKSMVEIVTPVCSNTTQAASFLKDAGKVLSKIGEKNGFKVAALATHPFEKKSDNEIMKDARYEKFAEEFQIVIKNFLISGLHIHIGMDSKESALKAYNSSINYLPIFLALSANSPFFQSEYTGLYSYRTKIFEQLPRAGVPQYFDSYEDYEKLYEQLFATKTIELMKDIWWDVRIHPNFGTIELRVCDSFYDYDRLRLIALLFQALLAYSLKYPPKREFYQVILQNRWNAARHGLRGKFIEGNKAYTIREKILDLIEDMRDKNIFKMLNEENEIDNLIKMVTEKPFAYYLKKVYDETGDFKKIIDLGVIS